MDISRTIQEGRLINVSSSLEGGDWYGSKILKVDRTSFRMALPQKKYSVLPLVRGSKIRIGVPSNQGLFLFTSEVLAEATEQRPEVEVGYPQEIFRMERRAYPRLPVRLETYYAELRGGIGGLTFTRTMTLDISGGGLRMETNRPCPPETLLRLRFQIPSGDPVQDMIVTGRIVRTIPTESMKKSQVGVEFIDIAPQKQEVLARYVIDNLGEATLQA